MSHPHLFQEPKSLLFNMDAMVLQSRRRPMASRNELESSGVHHVAWGWYQFDPPKTNRRNLHMGLEDKFFETGPVPVVPSGCFPGEVQVNLTCGSCLKESNPSVTFGRNQPPKGCRLRQRLLCQEPVPARRERAAAT